jgi:hypothetical protein
LEGGRGARFRDRRAKLLLTAVLLAGLFAGARQLRGVDRVADAAAGWCALPYAALGKAERWLRGGGLTADPARAERARRAAEELEARERAAAQAGRAGLRERGGVVAAVRARTPAEATYEIDRGAEHGVKPGDPVTFGDVFAGVVESVKGDSALVRHPWHRSVRLCLQTTEAAPTRLVAAGAGDGILRIVVSKERVLPPTAAVELAPTPDGSSLDAAAGFRVGTLHSGAEGFYATIEADPNVQDERMVQVVVRTQDAAEAAPDARLEAPSWIPLTLLPAGDASPGRASALVLSSALFDGAAVAFDGQLVGVVARAGGPTARVRFVEDPGFTVRVVLLTPTGPPIPLRRVRTAGGSGRQVILEPADRWGGVPKSASGLLLTAGGDGAVPKGLLLGEARIEDGDAPGRARIHLTREFRGSELELVSAARPVRA